MNTSCLSLDTPLVSALKPYGNSVQKFRSPYSQNVMKEVTANQFRDNLKREVDRVTSNHEVLRVTRRNGEDFVVVAADDWSAIEETLYLNQFPGLVESIHQAAAEAPEQGVPADKLDW